MAEQWVQDEFTSAVQARIHEKLARLGIPIDVQVYAEGGPPLRTASDSVRTAITRVTRERDQLEDLNRTRMTKIRRLRQAVRSYQSCHERDIREIQNLRQKLAASGLEVTRLKRRIEELEDDIEELL